MNGVKLSVSLSERDVEFLDVYVDEHGVASRSAAIRAAVRMLRAAELGPDYAHAWDEWTDSDDNRAWESTVGDGLKPDS